MAKLNNIVLCSYFPWGKLDRTTGNIEYLVKHVDLSRLNSILNADSLQLINEYMEEMTIIIADRIAEYPHNGGFADALKNKFEKDWSKKNMNPVLIITHSEQFGNTQKKLYSIFDNSNIWIRTIYSDSTIEEKKESIEEAMASFTENRRLGLYKQESAWEYFKYHLSIQRENRLDEGHKNIIPNRYSSEVFTLEEKQKMDEKAKAREDVGISRIGIRMLLVDDKIQCAKNSIKLKSCFHSIDKPCTSYENCKLYIIRELLTDNNTSCSTSLCSYVRPIWYVNKVGTYIIGNKDGIGEIDDLNLEKELGAAKVHVVGTNSIELAIEILKDTTYKYDVILLDYYFNNNKTPDKQDSYGIELLRFINDEERKEKSDISQSVNLENRFWIFPITAFPSSFLTHLNSEGIPLLTSKWYIYNPTNPIVTPKRFLYNLNTFIEMMVKHSIYEQRELINFFIKTCDGISTKYKNTENKENIRELYVAYMGAEYRCFIQFYGSRLNIARDKNKSLFARSIWDDFYDNKISEDEKNENKTSNIGKAKLLTLHFLMQEFFYTSSYLTDDRHGRERLRLAWINLYGYLVSYCISQDKHEEEYLTKKQLAEFNNTILSIIDDLIYI